MAASVRYGFESALSEVCDLYCQGFTLKPEQLLCIKSICVDKRDVFAQLPTGFGKSVIYQLVPKLCSLMDGKDRCVIVVSPLHQIMKEQIKELMQAGISSTRIGEAGESDQAIADGKISVVFGTAEQWKQPRWIPFLKNANDSISAYVIDEAHTVSTWLVIISCFKMLLFVVDGMYPLE